MAYFVLLHQDIFFKTLHVPLTEVKLNSLKYNKNPVNNCRWCKVMNSLLGFFKIRQDLIEVNHFGNVTTLST